ncbi:MAG: hypothetical protein K6E79_08285, partial [Pseudobutyrivibrio sp.]|nr:hypothetical protein [Pseudobutyrivibrio sp.]
KKQDEVNYLANWHHARFTSMFSWHLPRRPWLGMPVGYVIHFCASRASLKIKSLCGAYLLETSKFMLSVSP